MALRLLGKPLDKSQQVRWCLPGISMKIKK